MVPEGQGILYLGLWLVGVVAGLYGAGHALLNNRDPRSAAAWAAICLTLPILGFLAYLAIGKNRIRTRARRLQGLPEPDAASPPAQEDAEQLIPPEYRNLAFLGRAASGNALLTGNAVALLQNGDEAYPAMLDAIRRARSSVHLASYIFDSRGAGEDFVRALGDAVARGVTVRVLLDGFGEFYSLPRVGAELASRGVQVRRFLPLRLFPPSLGVNLRNHRKILVVDGCEAFTGGMNIRSRHCSRPDGRPPKIIDLHFRLRGPVVEQIDAVFRADWLFAGGRMPADPAPPC
ncbi:MAG: phospholipase D-like domain-containing protein, partial [Gammaproteobacteria bacterium]